MHALSRFLLRDAEALAASVKDADRGAIAASLALGRQKARAAEALWSSGHPAEAMRLAREGLDATLDTTALVARATARDVVDPIAVLVGCGLARSEATRAIDARARALELPQADRDVSPAHAELYESMLIARRDVDRALDPASRTADAVRGARAVRIALLASAALLAVALLVLLLRPRAEVRVEASARYSDSPAFAPANAVDGDPATEWLLPDGQSGTLDLDLAPPRRIERVTLTGGRNAPYHDRAIHAYRIELSAAGRELSAIEGSLERSREPAPVSHDVGADGVDRVRVVVVSWHGTGASLAEIALE